MGRTATSDYLLRALLVVLAAAVVAAGLLALVGAKPAWAEGLSFAPAQKLALQGVANPLTADFNGDGKDDLVVTNYNAKQVSVMLGNGDGTFQEKQDFAVAGQPSSVTSADFNGDDHEDLAVTNHDSASASSKVSVLLGNGDGTFQEKKDLAVEYGSGAVTSADFNGDGKADLAARNSKPDTNSSNVSVLLGNGDGTFQTAKNVTLELLRPVSMTAADFNGDGKADLAVGEDSSSSDAGVSVLLGNGDGTFQEAVNYAAGSSPDHVITADFNGDGNEDLATSTRGGDIVAGPDGVSVMLGKGDGTFQDPSSVPDVYKPNSITAADFDGDRNVDLATAHYDWRDGNPGYVSVRLGYGDGVHFQEAQDFTVANYTRDITSGDLNADNYPDLVTSHSPETYGISVLMNIPAPKDTTAPTINWVYPEEGAEDIWPEADVYVGFSEAMDRSTLTNNSFTLSKQGSSEPIEADVSYNALYREATLNPHADLEEDATYTATVKGESSGTEDVVKDVFGNALAADKTWSFTLPPVAPSQPPDLDAASDTGSSDSDNITSNNKPTFTGSPGSVKGGSTVKIYVDGVEQGSATAATDGSYRVETTSTLDDGAHSVTATATAASGNTSAQSPASNLTVDTKAPVATAPVHSYALSMAVASAASDSTVPVQLTWGGTDSGSSITKYELQQSLDRGNFATVASSTSTSLSQWLKPGTTLYRFQVRAEDKAGNTGAFVAGPEFKVTSYQETPTSTVSYPAGKWTTQSVGQAYGGSVRYASAKGAKATFSVPAGSKNIAWVAPKASNRGMADVYLDGVFQQKVDLYSAWQFDRHIVFSKAVDPSKSHTLEVRVLGTKQSASTGTRVDIDAFLATG